MDKFKVIPTVSVVLKKNNQIFLLRRSHTGSQFDGVYTFMGGHVDGNETIRHAAIREVFEEVGVTLSEDDLHFIHVVHRKRSDDQEMAWFFFLAEKWQGQPYNKESDKHDLAQWFSIDNLPNNISPAICYSIIENINKRYYSEFGW